MANIQNNIGLNDMMTPTLRHIITTINMVISNLERLDQTTNLIGADAFSTMRQEVSQAEIALQRMEAQLSDTQNGTQRVRSGFSSWALTLTGVYSALGIIKGIMASIQGFMNKSDEFVGADARLNLINDGLQTQEELQNRVLKAANNTRASYTATADLVAKIGLTGAMKTNEEAVGMAEKVNKLLKIGGGGAAQNEAALLQFSQSLASGRMQGDEFRSLTENAPALMNTLAKGMGVSRGSLKEMSSDGLLTTETIIEAMKHMGTEIDEQFARIPVTFGDNMTQLSNTLGTWMADMAEADGAIGGINKKFVELNVWLGSENGQSFLYGVATGLNLIVYIISGVIDGFNMIFGVIELLGPISDMVLIGSIATGLLYVIPLIYSFAASALTSAATAATGWIMANLPLVAMGMAIGFVIMALNQLGFSASDILSFVGGLFGWLFAIIVNGGVFMINRFLSIAEFFVNIFIDPVYAVKKLFWDLTSDVLGFFDSMINGIISGFNWVANKSNEVIGTNFKSFGKIDIAGLAGAAPTSERNIVKFSRFDYIDTATYGAKGADMATGFLNKMGNSTLGLGNTGAGNNIGDIGKVDSVGKIDKDVNIAKEDLEMMLEMVTQNRVNQINLTVTTKAPIINSHATVREEADARKLASEIADMIYEGAEIGTDLPYEEEL